MSFRALFPPGCILPVLWCMCAFPARADTLFFKAGMPYVRNLDLSGAGSPEDPIVITTGGTGRAVIVAGYGHGLRLDRCRNVTIRNLEFRGAGRLEGNRSDGVMLSNCREIVVEDVEISGFQHSGLLVTGASMDIEIRGVLARDNGFAGIHVLGPWPDKRLCRNITITRCRALNNPGDPTVLNNHSGSGILVGACDSVLIENCEAAGNGWDMPRKGNGPVGIWAWHADHVLIQHCISHDNRTSPGGADGGGFDLDGGVTASVIQFCLSYGNEGAGFGLFEYTGASPWRNNTLRYNISINDGTKNGHAAVMVWNGNALNQLLGQAYVYHNVFLNQAGQGRAIQFLDDRHEDFLFANNLFLTGGPALSGPSGNADLLGNVYWNLGGPFSLEGFNSFEDWTSATGHEMLGDSVVGMNLDPMLVDPGPVRVTDPDSLDGSALSGFRLQSLSPVIDRGIGLGTIFGIDPGETDLFGNTIPQGPASDPGVHEAGPFTGSTARYLSEKEWIQIIPGSPAEGTIRVRLEPDPGSGPVVLLLADLQGRVLSRETYPRPGEEIILQLPSPARSGQICLLNARSGPRSCSRLVWLNRAEYQP